MTKTRPYFENGFLELANNTAERAMKSVAIGRKNWMFAPLSWFASKPLPGSGVTARR